MFFAPFKICFWLCISQTPRCSLSLRLTVTGRVLAAAQTDDSFDVQLCGRRGGAARLPRCRQVFLRSVLVAAQVLLRDAAPTSPWMANGFERRGQAEFPRQRGQRGPGGTSQRPRVQLSPECDTVASASLPLISEGRAGRDSIAKCEMGGLGGVGGWWTEGGGLG